MGHYHVIKRVNTAEHVLPYTRAALKIPLWNIERVPTSFDTYLAVSLGSGWMLR